MNTIMNIKDILYDWDVMNIILYIKRIHYVYSL